MRNNSNRLLKRLMILFAGIIGVFGLSSCTKTFATLQDQANQLYAHFGNLYATSVEIEDDEDGTMNTTLQNQNRTALFATLSESQGYTSPDKDWLTFMDNKAHNFAEENYHYWTDSTFAKEDEEVAKNIALHVSIYAGIKTDEKTGKIVVSNLFSNFDMWYEQSINDDSVGVLKAPSKGFVNTLKTTLQNKAVSIRAGFAPENGLFKTGGSEVYIEGKSWGQAFAEYGFLEGLFVYPFAWLVHQISSVDLANGWMQILAIFIITILARSITVISTYFQTKSQAKQQRIQPLLNQLQKKYPNSKTDPEERRAMAMEQQALMKRAKVHPFLPMLFMILQFPLFICVWAALQDSAALATGNWLGLSLTTVVSACFTQASITPGAPVGIVIFIVMTLANVLASFTSLFFSTWRTKNFGGVTQTGPDGNPMDPNKTMKYMTIIMSVFIVFMGWSLPVGMGIYWLFGSIISIMQTLIMEFIQMKQRHKFTDNTGDGSTLAAIRRSKHHNETKAESDKKAARKAKSQKPMWR